MINYKKLKQNNSKKLMNTIKNLIIKCLIGKMKLNLVKNNNKESWMLLKKN